MVDVDMLHARAAALLPRDGGLHPPPDVLLSWPRPNYVDPEERGWAAPIVLFIFMALTIMVYMARMWARLALSTGFGWDDSLITLSMIPLLGLTISVILAARVYGFQWHAWDQTAFTYITTRKITMSIELNYMFSTTLIKISILCFYRRITGRLTNTFVYWVWGMIIFCAVYGIVFTFLIIFTCSPVVGYFHIFDLMWRVSHEVTCHDEGAIIAACAIISTVQDLVICMLPVFLIWNLKIQKRQKIALCGIFGMGLITCVCGIMRSYYATYVYYYTYDITWYAYPGWIWTVLEAQLGVICASAPALKVFFGRYFNLAATRMGYASSSKKTPFGTSRSYGKITPLQTANSMAQSQIVTGEAQMEDVPLSGIKVSQGLDVRVELRDDHSQKSFASTSNLTALPMPAQIGWREKNEWVNGCRAMCANLKPSSRSARSASRERDIESGAGGS